MTRRLSRNPKPTPSPPDPLPALITQGAASRLTQGVTAQGLSDLLCALAWAHGLLSSAAASRANIAPDDWQAITDASRRAWRAGAVEGLRIQPHTKDDAAAALVAAFAKAEP